MSECTVKSIWGSGVTPPFLLNPALGGGVVSFIPQQLNPQKESSPHLLNRKLSGHTNLLGGLVKRRNSYLRWFISVVFTV